ncbi:MAG: ribosome assembly factor SBDS [Nanoarchaeota archaeon]|nr:ribosome assembly factor SBDS [Nanoarchaeota archaeon]
MNTLARIKQKGKHFEIIVDLDKSLKFKKGESSNADFLEIDSVFSDSKKGFRAKEEDLEECFGTEDVYEIAKKIVKQGEVLVSQEHRDEEREKKLKQVIDFLSKNAINPSTGNPHTPERIKSALEEAHVNIKNASIDGQINDIITAISPIIPIKIEKKRVKITVSAIHTGKAYGVINQYKEKENWLPDGSLEAIISIPAGLIMDFYDKLNAVTHGSAITEEMREGDLK